MPNALFKLPKETAKKRASQKAYFDSKQRSEQRQKIEKSKQEEAEFRNVKKRGRSYTERLGI